jgi:hypothetical protein
MDRPGFGMRGLIGLLLALNLGVFLAGMALQQWTPAEPTPLVFNAEKIRLLAVPTSSNPTDVLPDKTPEASPLDVDTALNMEMNAATSPSCLSWKSLDVDGFMGVVAYLKKAGISASTYDIELEKPLGWWVYLPPVADKEALQVAIDEVRRLGVTDYAPVRGGSMRNALSLGAFANLAQAREHAAKLVRKGIKGVLFGPRPETGMARLVLSKEIADSELPILAMGWPKGLQPARCVLP